MSIRLALILSGVWTVLVIAGSAIAIVSIVNGPPSQQQERASKAGGTFGIIAAIGYGGIWVPWAMAKSKKKPDRPRRPKRRTDDDPDNRPRKRKQP